MSDLILIEGAKLIFRLWNEAMYEEKAMCENGKKKKKIWINFNN